MEFEVNKPKKLTFQKDFSWGKLDKRQPYKNVDLKIGACYSSYLSQRASNPHKISFRSRGSTGFVSSFRYSFMLYFSYKIGPCFAFFHVKCIETFSSFTKYILDVLYGALIGLVHSPLVRNITENLMTVFIFSKLMPLFSSGV